MLEDSDMQAIRRSLSDARLAPFLQRTGGDAQAALRLYVQDMQKAARLWPLVHAVEVTLHNRTHAIMSIMWGQDWLHKPHFLKKKEQERILKAIRRLPATRQKQPTADDMIASLSLGFWVTLYDSRYDAAPHMLWRRGLHRLFPGKSHKRVRRRLERIRYYRNRIAHHENLLRHDEGHMTRICRDILTWMCPRTARWACHAGRLPPDEPRPQSS